MNLGGTEKNTSVLNTTQDVTMTRKSSGQKLKATTEKRFNIDAKQDYHLQGLEQSSISFWFALISSGVGFLVILGSLIFLTDKMAAGIVAGAIIEAVSLLIFYMYKNSNDVMIEFFEKLRKDSNTVNAIDTAKSIDNTSIRDQVKAKISLYLIGIHEEKICKHTVDILSQECNCTKGINERE